MGHKMSFLTVNSVLHFSQYFPQCCLIVSSHQFREEGVVDVMNPIEPMRYGRLRVWQTYSCIRAGTLPVIASVSKVRSWAELSISGVFRADVPEKTCGYLQTLQ